MSNSRFALSKLSLDNLKGVHFDLQCVVIRAIEITDIDFRVIEGRRTLERQKLLFSQGKSRTLQSRHLTGHAVDIVPIFQGKVSWAWPHYDRLAPWIKAAARQINVPVEWGGDWTTFKDGPHWQLPKAQYPAEPKT